MILCIQVETCYRSYGVMWYHAEAYRVLQSSMLTIGELHSKHRALLYSFSKMNAGRKGAQEEWRHVPGPQKENEGLLDSHDAHFPELYSICALGGKFSRIHSTTTNHAEKAPLRPSALRAFNKRKLSQVKSSGDERRATTRPTRCENGV